MSERSTYVDQTKGLRFHGGMTCDLAGTLALPDDELEGYFVEDDKPVPPDAARARLREWQAQGFQVMPICDKPDARGYCAGHPIDPEPEPVPLQFCEAKPLVDDLRTLKGLNLGRESYDHTSRPIIGMMTRGYRYWPRCDNTDRHGLCLGHPAHDGSPVEPT